MSPRTDLKVILRFSRNGESNFCAVLGCSNRSKREKDKGYYRIPAIVSRSKPKKQALSVERFGSPVLEGKILQLTLLNFTEFAVTTLYQVRNLM